MSVMIRATRTRTLHLMAQGRSLLLLISLLTLFGGMFGCVSSPPSAGVFRSFPPAFTATQLLQVRGGTIQQDLLAQVTRQGKHLTAVFLHPLMLQPLLRLEADGDSYRSAWLTAKPEELPFDEKRIIAVMAGIYFAEVFEQAGPGQMRLQLPASNHAVLLSKLTAFPHCVFPVEMALTFPGAPPLALRILTKELTC